MVNFKANLISYPKVDFLNKNNKYNKKEVAFVELDCRFDSDCIKEVSKKWNHGNTFAEDIAEDINAIKILKETDTYSDWSTKRRFFALTTQNSGLLFLNPSKIIALAEMIKENDTEYHELEFLQVKPANTKKNSDKQRKIKNIGKTLVNSIIKIYNNKIITVEPVKSAVGFYEKLGFKFCKYSKIFEYFTDKTMFIVKKHPF